MKINIKFNVKMSIFSFYLHIANERSIKTIEKIREQKKSRLKVW